MKGKLDTQQIPELDAEIVKESRHWLLENKGAKISAGVGDYKSPRISSEIADCSMPMTFDSYSFCSMGCLYCVVAGTKIATTQGKVNIEQLEVGDTVYSRNIESMLIATDKIVAVMERNVDSVLRITLENEEVLEITTEHPVYVNGFGWKQAGELQEGDDVNVSKRPDVSHKYRIANPMMNTYISAKVSRSLKKKYASGELDELKAKLSITGKKNIIAYNKRHSTCAMVSARMRSNNPMHNLETAAKVSATINEQYRDGRVSARIGKSRPDARIRMLSEQNPMKDPIIRKATLQKIVKSWKKNGMISEGEKHIRQALRELQFNFVHQCIIPGPNRDFIVDFVLPDYAVCIEYDGHSRHYTTRGRQKGKERDRWIFKNQGMRTVRIHRDVAFIQQNDLQSFIKKQVEL